MSEDEISTDNVTDDEEQTSDKVENTQPTNTVLLKENVTAYIKIDDLITEKRGEIKELNEKKLKYEEYIKKYLEKEKKDKIELSEGSIVFKKISTKQPLKEEIIQKAIIAKMKTFTGKKSSSECEKLAQDMIHDMDSMRGINIKNNIKRIGKKKQQKAK